MNEIKNSSIQKIKDIVDIGSLSIGKKLTTLDSLLIKIGRYQHLRFYYTNYFKEELDFTVQIQKSLDDEIIVCFIVMYANNGEIERYNITDLANSKDFLVNLYNGLCMQIDTFSGEAELNFFLKSKELSLSFGRYVWLNFDRSFIENNEQYEKFFDNLYNSKFDKNFNNFNYLTCSHNSTIEENKEIYKQYYKQFK